MGALNRLFNSTADIAREVKLDDEVILKLWKDYLATIPSKKNLVEKLQYNKSLLSNLKELKKLLEHELVDVHGEEIKEQELIKDLDLLEHSEKISRIQRLYNTIGYTETRYKYLYHLLEQIYFALKNQMHIVDILMKSQTNVEKLIAHLKKQVELESKAMEYIKQIKLFHRFFVELVKGEVVIQKLDADEKKLLIKMQKELSADKTGKALVSRWGAAVLNRIEDIVRDTEALMKMGYEPHPDVNFEFVNRPEFVQLAKETGKKIKGNVSNTEIRVFVHLFREWYNNEMWLAR